MKTALTALIFLIASILTYGQISTNNALKNLITYYEKNDFELDQLNLSLSKSPIDIKTNHMVIDIPFDETDIISYSIILNNDLISLGGSGKFICYNLEDFKRDLDFEKQLNQKKFEYHWFINNRLHALSNTTVYVWENCKWSKAKFKLPLTKQPKLFEDDEFVVFNDCHGEWGGTIYFFDKKTKKIYYTESTCANTVIKDKGNYLVLAHLGHMLGSSELKSIPDPRMLTQAKENEINKTKNGAALGYMDKTEAYTKIFDFSSCLIFSTFLYNDRQIFIVNYFQRTFLAEIINNEIQIIHPFFNDGLYMDSPVTSTYGDYILINNYDNGYKFGNEISVILIKGNELTKIDWNNNKD